MLLKMYNRVTVKYIKFTGANEKIYFRFIVRKLDQFSYAVHCALAGATIIFKVKRAEKSNFNETFQQNSEVFNIFVVLLVTSFVNNVFDKPHTKVN